jgi:hypothetical protein
MRDLQADLELCEKATPGPWTAVAGKFPKVNSSAATLFAAIYASDADAQLAAAAREGWPEAIRRALAAEGRAQDLERECDALLRVLEEVWLQWGFELSPGRRDAGCVGVLKHVEDILRRHGRIDERGRFAWEEAERDARAEAR